MPRRFTISCLALLLGASSLVACTKKPSETQCGEFADHMVELLQASRDKPSSRVKKLAQEKRDDLIGDCVRDGSVEEVECVMGQSSLADIAQNCK